MVFKSVGVILLVLAVYLAIQPFVLASQIDGSRALVYPLLAIFLVLTVRVLQAEKHHREKRTRHQRQRFTAFHGSRPESPADLPEPDVERANKVHAGRERHGWAGD